MSNSVYVNYTDATGSHTEAKDVNSWFDTNWLKNALKYGVFIPKGANIKEAIKAALNRDLGTIFDETTAARDEVVWMALFNTYKDKINKDAVIVDQLAEGQNLNEIAIYTVSVSGYNTQIKSLKERLVLDEDYTYTYNQATKKVEITLLKDTSETIAIFLSVDAAEDIFTYKNTITLSDQNTSLRADGQVEKSAKKSWLTKSGVQNTENKRLSDWEVMINADSRTIKDAVVTDTVNYNQQTFLRDAEDKVIVDVYKAVRNGNVWEKGEKVNFTSQENPTILSDMLAGTQSLVIAFEETITTPYFIVYQTQIDPSIVNNEVISNSVKLVGSDIEIHSVNKEIIVKSTDGSGTSSGTNGSLTIKKYDAAGDKDTGIDKEAVFQLSRKNAQGTYEVIFSDIVVKNNQIISNDTPISQISNLRYGDYMIQEMTPPEGYERDATQYTFIISDKQVDYVFELANKKEIKATSLSFSAEKILSGRNLQANEFMFELLDKDGKVLQTQSNTAEGKIYFEAISYDKAGEYSYTIREKVGTDDTITYDKKEVAVKVTVKDNAGQLEATASYEGTATFENSYTPKAGSVVLEAAKVLSGRNLQANEFTFELLDKDGKVLETQSNTAEGKIYFEAISYDKAGEYSYTIREKAGTDDTIKYDTTTYPVEVTVTEQSGQFVTEVSYTEKVVFNNSVKEKQSQSKTKKLPKNGDHAQIGWTVLGVLLIIVSSATYVYKRKRQV